VRGWLWIPALVGAALVAAVLDEDSGIGNWWRLREDVRESHVRIAEVRTEIVALREEAEVLEGDEFAIERAIREELDYARPGETVIRLPREGSASSRFP
jgi:cell division protein FtsB